MRLEEYIKILKARLISLKEIQQSKDFEEHYKSYSEETYKQQYDYCQGKIYELGNTITELEILESLTLDNFPPALIERLK